MTNLKLALLIAGGATPFLLADYSPAQEAAQQRSPTFELAMCNMTDVHGLFVAIASKQTSQKWWVTGWYALPDYGCTLIGTFPRDAVYFYAESTIAGVTSTAPDNTPISACIDHDRLFQGPTGGKACPQDQERVDFTPIKVPATTPRVTFTF